MFAPFIILKFEVQAGRRKPKPVHKDAIGQYVPEVIRKSGIAPEVRRLIRLVGTHVNGRLLDSAICSSIGLAFSEAKDGFFRCNGHLDEALGRGGVPSGVVGYS